MSNFRRLAASFAALFVFPVVPALQAQVPGVTDQEIVIGSCSVLDGPASQLGQQFVMGATAYLNMINTSGGVNGRRIVLRAHEDSYDPAQADTCFGRLQHEGIFAGAFFVGTPTAAKYVPLFEANHLPLMGLFTGAELLYSPFHRHVVNIRASYFDETRTQVDHLWAQGIRKIAILYPNDAFGATVMEGLKGGLKKYNSTLAAAASYPRNTTQVDDAVEAVRASHPDAVLLVGPYASVAAMLRAAAKDAWAPVFLSVSFVSADDLIREAGKFAENVIITQVMPSYSSTELPAIALYRKEMAERFPSAKLGYVSLEGFVDAMVLVNGLKQAGKDLTREKFIASLEAMHDVDLGLGPDFRLNLSSGSHKGFRTVYSTVIHNGVAVPLTNWGQLLAAKE